MTQCTVSVLTTDKKSSHFSHKNDSVLLEEWYMISYCYVTCNDAYIKLFIFH